LILIVYLVFELEVYLSDSAFMGLCFSAIEVYKDECLGSLIGYKTDDVLAVEHAVPYQSAKRTPSGVEPIYHRESRVMELVDAMTIMKHAGYFHSHNQYGDTHSSTVPSDRDKESIEPGQFEIIVAVNECKRWQPWGWSEQKKILYGSLGDYLVHIAAYYKDESERISKCRIRCPYTVGLNEAFNL